MAKFKMWYIPQVPMKPFEVECETAEQAQDALDLITNFSIFEFENRVKPDYSDAGGVMVWESAYEDWSDYDIDEEEA